jgi:hypothetical protein
MTNLKEDEWKVDGSGTGSSSVAGFGIRDVETSGSATKVACFLFGGFDYNAFCIEDHTASNFRTIKFK